MARKNAPSLVVPGFVHESHAFEQLGITKVRTIGERADQVAHEKLRGGKPPVVEGSAADGTAVRNLFERLHEEGVIVDGADLGEPPLDVLAREAFTVRSEIAANVTSTTSTSVYSEVLSPAVTFGGDGTWRVYILCEASFTHSASSGNDYRLRDDSATLATATAVTQSTRERYSLDAVSSPYAAPGTYNFYFEYKCNAAGTATARSPWFLLLAERLT